MIDGEDHTQQDEGPELVETVLPPHTDNERRKGFGVIKVDGVRNNIKVNKTWSLGTPSFLGNPVKLSTGISYNVQTKSCHPGVGLHTNIERLGNISISNHCVSLRRKYTHKGKRNWTNFDVTVGLAFFYAGKMKPIFDPLPHDARVLATAGGAALLSGKTLGSSPCIPTPLSKTGVEVALCVQKLQPIVEIKEINALIQL